MSRISGWPGTVRQHRMALQLAEMAAEGDVRLVADVLAAEEDHLVLQERRADRRDLVRAQRPRQVDAADLGPQHRAGRRHRQPGGVVEVAGVLASIGVTAFMARLQRGSPHLPPIHQEFQPGFRPQRDWRSYLHRQHLAAAQFVVAGDDFQLALGDLPGEHREAALRMPAWSLALSLEVATGSWPPPATAARSGA